MHTPDQDDQPKEKPKKAGVTANLIWSFCKTGFSALYCDFKSFCEKI